ncbi:MAG: hypothetical protein Q9O62_13995 [Ardenticatenia bacterium]|nr:hypothetical protein [Ardenticatenia bacterium]
MSCPWSFRWRRPSACTLRDVAVSVLIGLGVVFFFHADHLTVALGSLSEPTWWWHLIVDAGYTLLYAGLAFVGLRGWRAWHRDRR